MKIKALQHMFTSSPRGGGGFQTIAYTKGLMPNEIYTLEELVTYPIGIRFWDSGNQPLPEIFRVIKLNEKHFACSKSIFVSKDFAGRPGNYFSHSLVFDASDIEQARYNLIKIFNQPNIFERHYEAETSLLPEKEIDLEEWEEFKIPPISEEILKQFGFILDTVIQACKNLSSVFIFVERTEDILPLLNILFATLPPWLRREITFTTLSLNPLREASNYRIMFSLPKYHPVIPSQDKKDIITFDFTSKKFPQVDLTSTWAKLISSFLQNNNFEKISALQDLHWRYGKENPLEVAEILAKLTTAEDEFYEGQNLSSLSVINSILAITNSKTKVELLQSRIEQISKTLLERGAYDIYIELLYLLKSQAESEIQTILKERLEILINDPSLFLLLSEPSRGPKLLTKLILFAQITEGIKKFVFGSVGILIENNPDTVSRTLKKGISSLQKESDTQTIPVLEELFLYLVSKFRERTNIAPYIFEMFAETGIPLRKIDATLDILNIQSMKIETYIGWVVSFIQLLSNNKDKRNEVVLKAIRHCIDKGIQTFVPVGLNNLLNPLSWKECEAVQKNIEKFYKKGKRLKSGPSKSFLFFGKRGRREQTKEEIVYNEIIRTIKEIVWVKRKQR